MVIAINKKYQRKVNAFVNWNAKYDVLVNAEKEETTQGHNAYSKACDYFHQLPKREQANIEKHIPTVKGCY